MNDELLKHFFQLFPPSSDGVKPTEDDLEFYADKLPQEILDMWSAVGFGNLGNGILKLIYPDDYMESFYEWLGGADYDKIPLFMTAFGDIYYLRTVAEDQYDICFLDIHRRDVYVRAYSLYEFFNVYIMEQPLLDKDLKRELFTSAFSTNSKLAFSDIYTFVLPLKNKGTEDAQNIIVGDAATHQIELLALT